MVVSRGTDPAGGVRVVLVTAPDMGCARALARALVGEAVAACVSLLPGMVSIYRWKGAVHEAQEVLLLVKTRSERLGELERIVAREHPYEVPEVVALEPAAVAQRYLDWLLAECSAAGDDPPP